MLPKETIIKDTESRKGNSKHTPLHTHTSLFPSLTPASPSRMKSSLSVTQPLASLPLLPQQARGEQDSQPSESPSVPRRTHEPSLKEKQDLRGQHDGLIRKLMSAFEGKVKRVSSSQFPEINFHSTLAWPPSIPSPKRPVRRRIIHPSVVMRNEPERAKIPCARIEVVQSGTFTFEVVAWVYRFKESGTSCATCPSCGTGEPRA